MKVTVPADGESKLVLVGHNSLIVPKGSELYHIRLYNSSHLLYQSRDLEFENKLVPKSTGVFISRQ